LIYTYNIYRKFTIFRSLSEATRNPSWLAFLDAFGDLVGGATHLASRFFRHFMVENKYESIPQAGSTTPG